MGFLLERPELEDEANPMSPGDGVRRIEATRATRSQAGFKVRMTLLRQLEHYAEDELQRIYHDLNSHLVRAPHPSRRASRRPRAPRAAAASAKAAAAHGRAGSTALQRPPRRAPRRHPRRARRSC